jgi:hypothetical protein
MPDSSGPRKRILESSFSSPRADAPISPATSAVQNETLPIMQSSKPGSMKDYNTLSPDLRARDHAPPSSAPSGVIADEGGAEQEGTTGSNLQPAHEHKKSDSTHDASGTTQGETERERENATRNETRRATTAESATAESARREKGWWTSFWEKYGSVELDNKGSVARDHLALGMLIPFLLFFLSIFLPIAIYPFSNCPKKRLNTLTLCLETKNRTYFSSLAPYFTLFCKHRHSDNTALPP